MKVTSRKAIVTITAITALSNNGGTVIRTIPKKSWFAWAMVRATPTVKSSNINNNVNSKVIYYSYNYTGTENNRGIETTTEVTITMTKNNVNQSGNVK